MMCSNDKPQDEIFYSFNLDDVASKDRLPHRIDRFLELSELREDLTPYYGYTGRPSIDPEPYVEHRLPAGTQPISDIHFRPDRTVITGLDAGNDS